MAFIWIPGEPGHYAIVTPDEKRVYETRGDAPAWMRQADRESARTVWDARFAKSAPARARDDSKWW